ncbi:unnamed protein product [Dimorphilus gyrociliatus]|uniref:Uncharacterized protein n=1 Tax=Dimorphilus gyrociliatus TaxID=2664684 RepID=A0A7I8VB57_9ANNE|nr:unnamed protein product [Dimorphilus gyrociliatus]
MKTKNVPDLFLFILTASNCSPTLNKDKECRNPAEKFCNVSGECRNSKYSCLCINDKHFDCNDKRCVDKETGCSVKSMFNSRYRGKCIRGYEWCSRILHCVKKNDYDQRCKSNYKTYSQAPKCDSFKKICSSGQRLCIDSDEFCPDEGCTYNLRKCGYRCYADSEICELNLQSQCDGSAAIRCNSDNNVLILFYIIIPILLILLAAYGMYQKFIKSVRPTSLPFLNYGLANMPASNRDSNMDVDCSASSSDSPPKYEDVVKETQTNYLHNFKNESKNTNSSE